MSVIVLTRIIGFVLRHEVLAGWAAVLAGALLAGGLLAHRADAPALARATAQAQASAVLARTTAAQAQGQAQAAAAIDVARDREARITRFSEAHADALDHPSTPEDKAAATVAPDVLRDWASGVDGLRDEAARARGASAPGDDASRDLDPARALPPPR